VTKEIQMDDTVTSAATHDRLHKAVTGNSLSVGDGQSETARGLSVSAGEGRHTTQSRRSGWRC
jgi:hypothetical protein